MVKRRGKETVVRDVISKEKYDELFRHAIKFHQNKNPKDVDNWIKINYGSVGGDSVK